MADARAPLVLDTHVWLWLMEGAVDELGTGVLDELEHASSEGRILVSAISVWEVAMLEALHRISLSRPVTEWVDAALRAPGTRMLELSTAILIDSSRLPAVPPRDPADRMLLASARVERARLVTRDRSILDYAAQGHAAVLDARQSQELRTTG